MKRLIIIILVLTVAGATAGIGLTLYQRNRIEPEKSEAAAVDDGICSIGFMNMGPLDWASPPYATQIQATLPAGSQFKYIPLNTYNVDSTTFSDLDLLIVNGYRYQTPAYTDPSIDLTPAQYAMVQTAYDTGMNILAFGDDEKRDFSQDKYYLSKQVMGQVRPDIPVPAQWCGYLESLRTIHQISSMAVGPTVDYFVGLTYNGAEAPTPVCFSTPAVAAISGATCAYSAPAYHRDYPRITTTWEECALARFPSRNGTEGFLIFESAADTFAPMWIQILQDGRIFDEIPDCSGAPSPTPTNTTVQTPTPTLTGTPTQTPTQTLTGTPTQTPTQTPTNTPTSSPTPTQTPTPTPTTTTTIVATDTPTPTPTPTAGPSISPSPTTTIPPTALISDTADRVLIGLVMLIMGMGIYVTGFYTQIGEFIWNNAVENVLVEVSHERRRKKFEKNIRKINKPKNRSQ
ncbi:MAG: hypothetical protein ACE5DX_05920 [Candidatus Dojkabacteria bacterium]